MKLLNTENQPVEAVDFGIVEVGATKTLEYFLYNDEGAYIDNIDIKIADQYQVQEVTVSSYPTSLEKNEKILFTLAWKPTLKIKEGLKVKLDVHYRRLYG